MIIGSGLVANGFRSYEKNDAVLIFASGVSDSKNLDHAAFNREKELLQQTIANFPEKKLIYFSTCSIYDSASRQSPYVHHKLNMESLVIQNQPRFQIFRVSNLVGKTNNPNTLLNYLYHHIITGRSFYVWKYAERNIIDIDDTVKLCEHLIADHNYDNTVINIANTANKSIPEIITVFESITGKKASYTTIDKGGGPEIDSFLVKKLAPELDIQFDDTYLHRVLEKYYTR